MNSFCESKTINIYLDLLIFFQMNKKYFLNSYLKYGSIIHYHDNELQMEQMNWDIS